MLGHDRCLDYRSLGPLRVRLVAWSSSRRPPGSAQEVRPPGHSPTRAPMCRLRGGGVTVGTRKRGPVATHSSTDLSMLSRLNASTKTLSRRGPEAVHPAEEPV